MGHLINSQVQAKTPAVTGAPLPLDWGMALLLVG